MPDQQTTTQNESMPAVSKYKRNAKLHLGRALQWFSHWVPLGNRLRSAASIPHTYLFRDVGDYEDRLREYWSHCRRPLRVLSVGCATGQEPYSVGIVCDYLGIPVSIMAVDISPRAIHIARTAVYDWEAEKAKARDNFEDPLLSDASLRWYDECAHYFQGVHNNDSARRISEKIRNRVAFQVCDIAEMQFDNEFDFIICRKMLYYLPALTRTIAIRNIKSALNRNAMPANIIVDGYTKKQAFYRDAFGGQDG
jgi:chemotaxis methyl-accepting protein methylase